MQIFEKIKKIPLEYYLFILMLIPCFFVEKSIDNDTYFLLKHGEYVFTNGIPTIEPFSMHDNLEFVMQQWLFSLIIYLIYSYFGQIGINIFVILFFMLITIFLQKILLLITNNKIISYILTVPNSFILLFFATSRPFIVTYLFTIILFYILIKYIKTNNKKLLLWLPVISVLQINIQCSMWIFLFIMILPFLFEFRCFTTKNIYCDKYNKIPLIISFIIMFFSGYLNPYKHKAMFYIFNSMTSINLGISEMATPTILNASGTIIIAFTIITSLLFINIKEKINIRYLFLYWGTLLLILYALKCLPYFTLAFCLLTAEILKNIKTKDVLRKIFGIYEIYIPILTIFLIILSIGTFNQKNIINTNNAYNAIDYLVENFENDNKTIYTGFNDGAYAIYKNLNPYIDPRMEIYLEKQNKKFDYVKEYNDLQTGKLYYKEFLTKYNFDYILLNQQDIMYTFLKNNNNYELIYNDEYCELYKKID